MLLLFLFGQYSCTLYQTIKCVFMWRFISLPESTFECTAVLLFYSKSMKNICEDTERMAQSRSTAFMRHRKKNNKEQWQNEINASYETADARATKNCNRRTTLEWSVDKSLGGLIQFYSRVTSPLYLTQLHITTLGSVHIWVLYLISEHHFK